MYTQCPKCRTVFRVTAEVLRAAQGEVRCGVCATTFDALANLSEEPFKAAAEPEQTPDPADSMTVEELPALEDIELSSAGETQAPDEAATAEAGAAPEDTSLEFHGDAGDLDRLFVVEEATVAEFDPAAIAAQLTAARGPPAEDPERTDEYPILVLDERDEPPEAAGEEVVLESAATADEDPPATSDSAYTAPRILIPEEMRERLAEEAAARSALATDFGAQEPASGERRWPWAAAAAALLLVLVAQVVHSQHASLLRQPGIGPLLAQVYEVLGQSLAMPTDLSAYELRQWGAASDPGQQGRLLLRASVVNRAAFAQPYPLLRLALQDRFGATLGVRDIGPGDYLPGETRSKLLGPGERADAEIRIVDPGQEAVGFEMDVCLPVDGGVRCASQMAAAAQ
ncbi:MAG: DUF3426 domain-containing protein [Steroidobacteraceae bacterium]|nr:DUF3426 domain-containing protein [Steroidobacteraceae bacterium]